MEEVTVFWKGTNKRGNSIGVTVNVKGFGLDKFINVIDDEVYAAIEEGQTIELPSRVLS